MATPTAEVRCERTDLPVSMCAHCRPTVEEPHFTAQRVAGHFTAQYAGACSTCDGYIEPGDVIAKLIDEIGYACPACIRESGH